MGWVWRNDDDDSSASRDIGLWGGSSSPYASGDSGHCATRKVVSTQCRTEEVEPGRFIRKCEKTEQIFKDCVGRYRIEYFCYYFQECWIFSLLSREGKLGFLLIMLRVKSIESIIVGIMMRVVRTIVPSLLIALISFI